MNSLQQINGAITAIEQGAQEYQLNNKRIRKADLSVLYKERRRLEQEMHNQESYGGVSVACFDGR